MPLLNFSGSPHGGRQRLLPEWNSQPPITPTTIIDHSIVGSADGAYSHFLNNTGIESHFIVDLDGEIWQLMNTDREADANLNANRFALSIETADNGDPDHFPWTDAQLESLSWLHNKLRAIHPTIPRRKVPNCNGGGLGYHSMCGTTSSNPWTPSPGKTCPGKPVRVAQWNDVLLPAFLAGEELNMAFTDEDKQFLRQIRDTITGEGEFTERLNTISKLRGQVGALPDAAEIAAAVVAALPAGAVDAAVVRAACENAIRAVFADAAAPA